MLLLLTEIERGLIERPHLGHFIWKIIILISWNLFYYLYHYYYYYDYIISNTIRQTVETELMERGGGKETRTVNSVQEGHRQAILS